MSVLCPAVATALPITGSDGLPRRLANHAARCDRCTTAVAASDRWLAELAGVQGYLLDAPPGTVERVMRSLGPVAVPDPERRLDHLVPVAAAAAAALATAAAGTAVLVHKHRHRVA